MKKITEDEIDCGGNDCKSLIIHGEEYKTLFSTKFENRKKWVKPDIKKVLSILPGTVLEISVKTGDEVVKDDVMLVLEAMKMKNVYYFPLTGKIKSVNVKAGDRIPKGFIMLEYE